MDKATKMDIVTKMNMAVKTKTPAKMDIPAHLTEIALHIHSVEYALKCLVCTVNNDRILVTPQTNKVDMFQLNDPVVCIYKEKSNIHFRSGEVRLVNDTEKIVEIQITDNDSEDERSIFERYPASMTVSVRRKFSSKRLQFIAKNISQYGLEAISPIDLDIDESIDIDLITGKYMFYFVGKVIRKEEVDNKFEYYIQLTNFDVATKLSFEAFLEKLNEIYMNLYIKAR